VLRYAIIGCGRISPNHLMAAKENNLNIVALCDIIIACGTLPMHANGLELLS
jgi:UDP-N-acetyl-2-amino-2-deoxyglucuronate dehydrogenase